MNSTITNILFICIAFTMGMCVYANYAKAEEQSSEKEIAYWKDRYVSQKKKSQGQYKRIKLLNSRVEALRGSSSPLTASIVKWVNLASCESGNNWRIDSGNGFFGGLQFDRGTWKRYGGSLFGRTANLASPIQQVAIAELTLRTQGRGAWPHCSSTGAW